MESNQQKSAIARQTFVNLAAQLRQHRALTRITLATLSLGIALAASLQGAAAGPEPSPLPTRSILPSVIGTGVLTDAPVLIDFEQPMDRQSVVDALTVRPLTAWSASWSEDGSVLSLSPDRRWRTDARYVVTIGGSVTTQAGRPAGGSRALSFTTETAPVISDFQLHYVEEAPVARVRSDAEADRSAEATELSAPTDTTGDVSAGTSLTLTFSAPMDAADLERGFTISPRVKGELTVDAGRLVFEPTQRLKAGRRYAVSINGAHDERGNPLGGDVSFSFTTRPGAQVTRVAPRNGARQVRAGEVHLWFSQPMDGSATRAALRVEPASGGREIAGVARWNDARTQLRYTFRRALPAGEAIRIKLGKGARDRDGNSVSGSWRFTTKPRPERVATVQEPASPQPTAPRPTRPTGPPPPSDIQQYALWQVNQARARYGFAPLRLDAAISEVASGHAWDMLNHGYFSHTDRSGGRVADRLRRAGIGFGHSGENICYLSGQSVRATLDWCHRTFMSEPYPGHFNHIANILSPRFSRMGIGIAQGGGQIKVVWDFAG